MLASTIREGLGTLDYVVVAIYMAAMMAVGVRFSRVDRSTEDYLLGGRSIVWWMASISYLMTLLSTISLVAVPGEAYNNGITLAVQNLIMPFMAIATFHLFMRFYFRTKMFTPFDYLERRFNPSVRALTAGMYWLLRVIYLGLALYATSLVFQGASNWPKPVTIILVGGIGMAYTLLGGLHAVVWTDLIQFVVLAGGIVVLLFKVCLAVPGGAWGVLEYAYAHDHIPAGLNDAAFYSISPFERLTLWGLIVFIANDYLFYNSSDQMAIQRLLSTANFREAKRSLYSCVLLQVPVFMILWFVGLAIFAFYGHMPADQQPATGDAALYRFIGTQLPPPIPGLVIAAMLAAVMSTIAGGFNSLTTVATVDFYQRFMRPKATEKQQVAFSRWITLVLGLASVAMGLTLASLSDQTGGSVVETSFVWLSLVWTLTPVFLLGILSRRAAAIHAVLALVIAAGVSAAMIGYYLWTAGQERQISFLFVGLPGPVLGLGVAYFLSRLSPRRPAGSLVDLTVWTFRSDADAILADTSAHGVADASSPAR